MAANLTRDEARTRAESITVDSYQVELDLTGGDTTFRSVVDDRFGCAQAGHARPSSTWPRRACTRSPSTAARSTPRAFDGSGSRWTAWPSATSLVVDAECAYSRSGEGLHRFADPADGNVYLYSDLETFDAHRIYACFDQPDMKATYQLTVRAPQDWYVVSNMAPLTDGGEPLPGDAAAGDGAGAGSSRRRR